MTNNEKYTKAFTEAFDITDEQAKNLKFQAIPEWDSVGHMTLIALLEDAFDIMLDTDDIIDLNSYETGIELLKKYEVTM